MGAQISGISGALQPNVFTQIDTVQKVNVISGGDRVVAVIGEGESEETLITSAVGGGSDGLDATYSVTTGQDGRHFAISKIGLVANRTKVLKNGVPLSVIEGTISTTAFNSRYDAMVEIATGRVQLQQAFLVDFGTNTSGAILFYSSTTTNIGTGAPVLTSASLLSTSAPAETWTARVVSVVKDSGGSTILGEATITVTGSESGQIIDTNGNPVVWKSDGIVVSNGILSFAFSESTTAFAVGDRWGIEVDSGVLSANDKLVVRYIAAVDVENPVAYATAKEAFSVHGQPSATNTLSLGISMAFENGAPQVVGVQAKPSVPRKTSETLIVADNPLTTAVEGATGSANLEDSIFPLSVGALPDVDTEVNIFIVNSDGTESQLLLSKDAFYNTALTSTALAFTNFVGGPLGQAYTVFTSPEVEQNGIDGYGRIDSGTEIFFSSPTVAFSANRLETGEGDVGKQLEILSPTELVGTYTIATVGDGYGNMNVCTATGTPAGVVGSTYDGYVSWQIVDPNDTSHAYFAITDDVATNNLTVGKGLRVEYINTPDADFFDTYWAASITALELVDVQILCPLPTQTISNIFQGFKSHVETQSNVINQQERIVIVGAINGLTSDNLVGNSLAAVENVGVLEGIQGDDAAEVLAGNIEDLANYSVSTAYGDTFRAVYMYPDQIIRNINGQNTTLSGYFMSPALGGKLAAQTRIYEPMTFQTLAGFSIPETKRLRRIAKNSLAGAGVLVVEPISGGGRMLWGKTTVSSGAPEEEEISIVSIRDNVAKTIRASLIPYMGKARSNNFIGNLAKGINKLLRSQVSKGLLSGYGNITIRENPVEARQVDIQGLIRPRGVTNWAFIGMSVEL